MRTSQGLARTRQRVCQRCSATIKNQHEAVARAKGIERRRCIHERVADAYGFDLKNWGTKPMGVTTNNVHARTPMYPVGNTEGYGKSVPSHKTANQRSTRLWVHVAGVRSTRFGCTLPASAMRRWACLGFGIPSGARGARGGTFYGVCRGTLQCTPATCPNAVALHPKSSRSRTEGRTSERRDCDNRGRE